MVVINDLLYWVNALSCMVIASSLAMYQRGDSGHKYAAAAIAWLLIVAAGANTILIFMGEYGAGFGSGGISETVINVVLCIAVVRARGNTMKLFKQERTKIG